MLFERDIQTIESKITEFFEQRGMLNLLVNQETNLNPRIELLFFQDLTLMTFLLLQVKST